MARVGRLLVAVLSVVILLVTIVSAGGDSPVTKAVKAGDVAGLRKLVASRADVNAASGDGSTPLLWAAHSSDLEMAKMLIAAGAKVDVANNYGITPLLDASRIGDAAMMDLLIKAGADPKRTHPEGETTLMAASRSGSLPAVRLLIERGVDANASDAFQKETALMWASAEGHVDVVDALLNAGADADRQARVTTIVQRRNADHPTGGFSALMWAARNGHEPVVRRLAKGGANLNLKNGDGASAAMIAIWNDRFDMAATLVELGADANDGSLYLAVEMRDATTDQFAFDGSRLRPDNQNKLTALTLLTFLLEHGADPNKSYSGQLHSTSMPNSDRFDNTPFYRAAITSDTEALKVLAAHGANLEQTPAAVAAANLPPPADDDAATPGRGRGNPNAGRTALMVTMTGGRGPGMTGGPGLLREGKEPPYREPGSRKPVDAFAALLKAGANPNAKAPDGNTMVHLAATAGNLDMIRALAEAGAKLDAVNNDKLTALDVAEGKQPEGARGGAGARGARGGGAPPPAGGRGGARGGGTSRAEVAAELRKLMGLPPAPPAPAAPAAQAAPATPEAQQ
jgi:ankyrin repeat protein